MSEMRDGLETAEQAIYESLGLVLPGAAALAGSICVLAPDALGAAIAFAGAHRWLALAACYLAGYPVQSLSRPVDKAMMFLPRGLLWLVRQLRPGWADAISSAWHHAAKWLQRGHKPEPEAPGNEDSRDRVRLAHLEHAHWHGRLGLKEDQRLDAFDVKNLSFSTLGAGQRRLHRFRAITSLNRAMAAIAGVAFWLTVYIDLGLARANTTGIAVAAACAVLFLAFRERANMYDALWNSIIGPQYLANTARPLVPDAALAGSPASSTVSLTAGVTTGSPVGSPLPIIQPDAQRSAPRLDQGDLRA